MSQLRFKQCGWRSPARDASEVRVKAIPRLPHSVDQGLLAKKVGDHLQAADYPPGGAPVLRARGA